MLHHSWSAIFAEPSCKTFCFIGQQLQDHHINFLLILILLLNVFETQYYHLPTIIPTLDIYPFFIIAYQYFKLCKLITQWALKIPHKPSSIRVEEYIASNIFYSKSCIF